MKKIYAIVLIMAVVVVSFSCSTPKLIGQDNGWEFIGQSKANHLREKDIIKIKSRDKFTEVRIYVFEGTIEIKDFEIMLINGDVLRPVIDSKILSGDRSRIIELAADGKQLDHIMIRYKAQGKLFTHKPLIQFGGRRLGAQR